MQKMHSCAINMLKNMLKVHTPDAPASDMQKYEKKKKCQNTTQASHCMQENARKCHPKAASKLSSN